jgi:hypothetical protein
MVTAIHCDVSEPFQIKAVCHFQYIHRKLVRGAADRSEYRQAAGAVAPVPSTRMANIDTALLRHCRCQRFRVLEQAGEPPQVPVAWTARALRRVVGAVANARAQPHCHSSNVRAYKDASP